MAEQFTLLRTDIREHTNTWNDNKNEVLNKQEEEVNKSYEEVRKVRDNDNAVDFTDVLATKKLSTVVSSVSVSSKPVSYTHLDVYKRQRIPQAEESGSITVTFSKGTPTTNTERRNRITMSSADPTSNPIWGLCNDQEF